MEVNQKQLAALLGISSRQVRNLKEQGLFWIWLPTVENITAEKCVQEYLDFKIKAEVGNGTNLQKEKEQAEHEKYKKEITKLKLRRLRKETHEAGDVEQFLNNMLIDFRNRLLSVPAKIAPIVIGQTDIHIIISELEKELEMTLEELSNYDPDVIKRNRTDWLWCRNWWRRIICCKTIII